MILRAINSRTLLLIYFMWIELLILCTHVSIVNSCEYLQIIEHDILGTMYFQQIPIDAPEFISYRIQETGRPSYVSIESNGRFTKKVYLIHLSDSFSGEGRWVFTKDLSQLSSVPSAASSSGLEDQGIIGYIRSWAILPYLYRSSQDPITTTHWYFLDSTEHNYQLDPSFTISCFNDVDKTIFIQAEFSMNPRIDGYYVERFLSHSTSIEEDGEETASRSVYSQIKFMENDRQLYLYRLHLDEFSSKWLIGFEYGVDSAYAFCEDSTEQAITIQNVWNVLDHFSWRKDHSLQILSVLKLTETYDYFSPTSQDLPEILRQIRSILPYSQPILEPPQPEQYYTLRNEVKIPMIGLGTGGIYLEESYEIFSQAMAMGYRLFDLAREYRNEETMGKVIVSMKDQITRDQLFLETKVWPTELGFLPTTNAIINSLHDLQSSYIDLYLLHWPECNWDIDWMHCETTIDLKGTWHESWFALEKAYSEGRIMSLGFSNANLQILEELRSFATILPHVIQNWSEIGQLDLDVRQWCREQQVIYQPYASIRNLRFQPIGLQQQIERIARQHNVTSPEVNLRFFLQTGASIIPRSTRSEHLVSNLRNTLQWSLTEEEMMELGWKWPSHADVLSITKTSSQSVQKEL